MHVAFIKGRRKKKKRGTMVLVLSFLDFLRSDFRNNFMVLSCRETAKNRGKNKSEGKGKDGRKTDLRRYGYGPPWLVPVPALVWCPLFPVPGAGAGADWLLICNLLSYKLQSAARINLIFDI
jgi:hypothetical protein